MKKKRKKERIRLIDCKHTDVVKEYLLLSWHLVHCERQAGPSSAPCLFPQTPIALGDCLALSNGTTGSQSIPLYLQTQQNTHRWALNWSRGIARPILSCHCVCSSVQSKWKAALRGQPRPLPPRWKSSGCIELSTLPLCLPMGWRASRRRRRKNRVHFQIPGCYLCKYNQGLFKFCLRPRLTIGLAQISSCKSGPILSGAGEVGWFWSSKKQSHKGTVKLSSLVDQVFP